MNGHKYTKEEIRFIKDNYLIMNYYEISTNIGVTPKAISEKIRRLGLYSKSKYRSEHKQTIKTIGSKRRANNRYNAILSRLFYPHDSKNKAYKNTKLLVTRQEFIEWFMPRDFDGASVDRIDKNGDYCLENMQVIPLSENIRKDKIKAKNGECVCYKCKKEKQLELFTKDKRRKNGYSTICIDCEKERNRLRYKRLLEFKKQ